MPNDNDYIQYNYNIELNKFYYHTSTSTSYKFINQNWNAIPDKGKAEKSEIKRTKLMDNIKVFFDSLRQHGYSAESTAYYIKNVPALILRLLDASLPEFVMPYKCHTGTIDESINSIDELELHNQLRNFGAYMLYNFLRSGDVDKLAQILFMRIEQMYYTDKHRKYILFVEEDHRCEELARLIKLSRILDKYQGSFNAEEFMGKYKDQDINITLGMLILRAKPNGQLLHKLLIK